MSLGTVVLIGVASLAVGDLTTVETDSAYQNEDYRVPAPTVTPPQIPVPETYEQAEQWLVDNAFYSQVAPEPVRCDARPIDVGQASDSQLDGHFEELMECLVRVWQEPVEAAQWQIYRPTVTVYGRSINTRCGNAEVNAFYCAADQQIYYSNRLASAVPVVERERWAADVVMAHEFGHALQGRTGILIASRALGQQSDSESADLELSRRTEVQADCLSGMFMRSAAAALGVQQADAAGILETFNAVGDDVLSGNPRIVGNHGLGQSREYWGEIGFGTGDVGACNSFVAAERLVR